MKHAASHSEATYGPAMQKTFSGALNSFLAEQFPQLGGSLMRTPFIQEIVRLVSAYYPETHHLSHGRMPWVTTDKNERMRYGKAMSESAVVPVVLTAVSFQEMKDRAEGKKLRDIKIERVATLCKEAYAQGGCITNAEIAIILKISASTVSKYIKEWEHIHGEMLPRRGTIHDLGPTLTHKKEICRAVFLEGKSIGDTAQETYHTPEAIHRYIDHFKRALTCRKKGFDQAARDMLLASVNGSVLNTTTS